MVRLTTERLLLREFEHGDWRAVHEYGSDPEVVRFLSFGPNTEQETRDFVARQITQRLEEPRRNFGLAVVRRTDGQLMGSIGLELSRPADRTGWTGYCLARRFWGQGYATEAARAIVGFGFDELDLHRIFATCDVANQASARVLEKVGMRREGQMHQDSRVKGQWRDSYLYAILEHEQGA